MKFVVLFLVVFAITHAVQGKINNKTEENDLQVPAEARIYEYLMTKYKRWNPDRVTLPRKNSNKPVSVTFGLTLQAFVDFDESSDVATFETWESRVWTDHFLTWDPEDYEGIRSIRVASDQIWTPDIELYNAIHHSAPPTDTLLVVSYDGGILHVPPQPRKILCSTNDTNISCHMKYGSWTRDRSGIDLSLSSDSADTSSYFGNKHYSLVASSAVRNMVQYDCCPEQYVDVNFKFEFKKKEESP